MQDERFPTTEGLTPHQYRTIVDELRRQPAWRVEANRCAAFYDGNQLTVEEREEYDRRGIEPVIVNQIKPLVNSLLGLEAKTRADWRVSADADEQQDLAEALSVKLHEAERETEADMACSDAFASQIKCGLGWVGVTRNADPFGYRYRVEEIDRSEIWWDWNARKRDLSDARYLVRERWYPTDTVCAYFPEHADVVQAAGAGWNPADIDLTQLDDRMRQAYQTEHSSGWLPEDWRDLDSRMVCLREVWYRVPVRGKVINLPDGRTVEYDKRNPIHRVGVEQGLLSVRKAVFTKLRVSLWVGPHKLQDEDYGRNRFPYVPFWGYREDGSRAPYGVVRDLVPLQKEINARRSKLQWLLASKRVTVDSDALDRNYNDMKDVAEEVARPDALVVLNPARRNANAFAVENDLALSGQQFQVMADAGEQMQKVAGIFNSMLGATDGAKSGTAIQGLVEQGNTMQADITDNYRFARRAVGQLLLEAVLEDLEGVEVSVTIERGGKKQPVTLNKPTIDALTGIEYRENDVTKLMAKVALNDVPSTPAYRAQAMVMVAEVIKGLPPQLQAPLVPYFLESTELPKRQEMADLVRRALGLGDDGMPPDPEKQQMTEMIQQLQAALSEAQTQLADKETEYALKARDLELKAQKTGAEVKKLAADTLKTRADTAASAAGLTQSLQAPPQPGPQAPPQRAPFA